VDEAGPRLTSSGVKAPGLCDRHARPGALGCDRRPLPDHDPGAKGTHRVVRNRDGNLTNSAALSGCTRTTDPCPLRPTSSPWSSRAAVTAAMTPIYRC